MFEEYSDVLTVSEATEMLRMGYNALYQLLETKKLRGFRNGKVWLISKKAIIDYILSASDLN